PLLIVNVSELLNLDSVSDAMTDSEDASSPVATEDHPSEDSSAGNEMVDVANVESDMEFAREDHPSEDSSTNNEMIDIVNTESDMELAAEVHPSEDSPTSNEMVDIDPSQLTPVTPNVDGSSILDAESELLASVESDFQNDSDSEDSRALVIGHEDHISSSLIRDYDQDNVTQPPPDDTPYSDEPDDQVDSLLVAGEPVTDDSNLESEEQIDNSYSLKDHEEITDSDLLDESNEEIAQSDLDPSYELDNSDDDQEGEILRDDDLELEPMPESLKKIDQLTPGMESNLTASWEFHPSESLRDVELDEAIRNHGLEPASGELGGAAFTQSRMGSELKVGHDYKSADYANDDVAKPTPSEDDLMSMIGKEDSTEGLVEPSLVPDGKKVTSNYFTVSMFDAGGSDSFVPTLGLDPAVSDLIESLKQRVTRLEQIVSAPSDSFMAEHTHKAICLKIESWQIKILLVEPAEGFFVGDVVTIVVDYLWKERLYFRSSGTVTSVDKDGSNFLLEIKFDTMPRESIGLIDNYLANFDDWINTIESIGSS
ncbi:MAG: hypothetical protein ACN4E2_01915, partial [Nitrospinota bacterium]